MTNWEFIATEFTHANGEEGERYIWEAVCKALKGSGEGIAILNYTDFQRERQIRYQPDILLVSRDLGLAVIEVKTCRIEQIVRIRANQWEMRDFYASRIYPFKQGENQLRQILRRCERNQTLYPKVAGRVLVALPLISREDWHHRGFEDDHQTCPPILFGDELSRRNILHALENEATILQRGDLGCQLSDLQWNGLKSMILGHPKASVIGNSPLIKPAAPEIRTQAAQNLPRRSEILASLRAWVSEVDMQQSRIGMQIPPGPQRIRGIAGSGKTLLLCQKAARMHLQHPDWEIAVVFFTRSLYELIPNVVRFWLAHWSEADGEPDLINGKLKVIHAWGSEDQPGLYSILRDCAGKSALVREKPSGSYVEKLASACKRLLSSSSIPPIFDAILIDEGQDLAVSDEWKFEDKQAIYWLAWQALRPIDSTNPRLKRLIWAYDEAQSLDTLAVPSYGEVFGDELGEVLSGSKTGPIYPGGIKKNEVMQRCYRTPGSTLVTAHAMGMGLLRVAGMLSGFTRKVDWEKIGYSVTQGSFNAGKRITIHRPAENSPNPIPDLWGRQPLEFDVYETYQTQMEALISKIKHNLEYDRLELSRDILVIILGSDQESQGRNEQKSFPSAQLQRRVVNSLQQQEISYFIPGATSPNRYSENQNPNQFWWENALTVSRMYRAKGHEAPMVYVLGLELIAQDESNLALRNQLFVALTRSTAWVHLSGIQDPETHTDYLLYEEMRKVMASGSTLKFTYHRPPKRTLIDE